MPISNTSTSNGGPPFNERHGFSRQTRSCSFLLPAVQSPQMKNLPKKTHQCVSTTFYFPSHGCDQAQISLPRGSADGRVSGTAQVHSSSHSTCLTISPCPGGTVSLEPLQTAGLRRSNGEPHGQHRDQVDFCTVCPASR